MSDLSTSFGGFHTLMRHRVEDILLVSSPYDCFILEEDGRFSDSLPTVYQDLSLTRSPRFQRVASARAALAWLKRRRKADLVVMTPHFADMTPTTLAREVKRLYDDLPVVMLAYDRNTAQRFADLAPSDFDEVFLWTGDPHLLLALVKAVEDRLNVERDTRKAAARVIVVVEDSPAFYSAYLPIIYTEVHRQVRSLMADVLNEGDRLYRARARPKILLARTYEEARELVRRFKPFLLGLITDMRFPRKGKLDPRAGKALIKSARKLIPDLPILLQSAEASHREAVQKLDVAFADKGSTELLGQLRRFMHSYLGFGPFIFRTPSGEEVARANDMTEMLEVVRYVPPDSLFYHVQNNHFSTWLRARGEFTLATEIRPHTIATIASIEQSRDYLVDRFQVFLEVRQRGRVTDYQRGVDPLQRDFTRIGEGSMGGKARGIAFASAALTSDGIRNRYPNTRVFVPRTKVLCTDIFDDYCDAYQLRELAMEAESDEEIDTLFLERPLAGELMADLAAILDEVRYPLAVRSSSLHEDSPFDPLAGLYATHVVPNCSTHSRIRLEQLSRAIRLVMASTFHRGPRDHMEAGAMRVEEERMAVIVQRLVGQRHGARFYPDFSGSAQSINFYPTGYMTARDGFVTVALGHGQQVVEGGVAYRFCPRHPKAELQMFSPAAALATSQRSFFALDLEDPDVLLGAGAHPTLREYSLAVAELDGTLRAVGATYSADNDQIVDTLAIPGPRVVNFAGVRKYDEFPLAPVLLDLLRIGEEGLGRAVEIEFAAALDPDTGHGDLGLLQLRPLVSPTQQVEVDLTRLRDAGPPILAGSALGNGIIRGVQDVVFVHPERFQPGRPGRVPSTIAAIDAALREAGRPYVLIGPGRWGTADPWLGIPVTWDQVCGAKVMVEVSTSRFHVDPSQGTHFFHNVTARRVGLFSVDLRKPEDALDLELLDGLTPVTERAGVRHVVLPRPLEVFLDCRSRRGLAVFERPDQGGAHESGPPPEVLGR